MVRLLDFAEKYISKSCPYIAGGLFVGAGYWSAVTYGAITVMQVMQKPRRSGVVRLSRRRDCKMESLYRAISFDVVYGK